MKNKRRTKKNKEENQVYKVYWNHRLFSCLSINRSHCPRISLSSFARFLGLQTRNSDQIYRRELDNFPSGKEIYIESDTRKSARPGPAPLERVDCRTLLFYVILFYFYFYYFGRSPLPWLTGWIAERVPAPLDTESIAGTGYFIDSLLYCYYDGNVLNVRAPCWKSRGEFFFFFQKKTLR